MLPPEELQRRIADLSVRYKRILQRKTELGGELKSKREELALLVKEIQAAGYNPKTLVEDRNRVQQELEALMTAFETSIVTAETTLENYDKK